MSAFVVSQDHINALVTWAGRHRVMYRDGKRDEMSGGHWKEVAGREDEVGQILWNENYRSVNNRYNESWTAPEFKWNLKFAVGFGGRPLSAVDILKACNCLDYQSCESEDWEDTVAHNILENIKAQAIRSLPGYEEAQWEIS